MKTPSYVESPVLLTLSMVFLALAARTLQEQSTFSLFDHKIVMPTEKIERETASDHEGDGDKGTKWAVLVAGSNGFGNYRHQADVCHAYQLLKKDGLKDENIVVFMYDDIADHPSNPRPGVIINHPQGPNVYTGVPKDYTGEHVTAENLYAVLLGDKTAVKGGSGKVVDSKPQDRIFLYYSDHGGPGVLGMPNLPYVYANDLIDVLKKKHASGSYKEMLSYIEACESGSIFEGIMPKDLNIFVTTASNAEESSYGTYCPGTDPPPPAEYMTCLGDLYSVAWMEDSERNNLKEETVGDQYTTVKTRTSNYNTYSSGSHVMQYGNESIKSEILSLYQGFNMDTANLTSYNRGIPGRMGVINQRDADLLSLVQMYKNSKQDSERRSQILKEITETVQHRTHLDTSIKLLGTILFGASNKMEAVRGPGLALVDDWDCLKSMVRVFETSCGSLTQYGMRYMRAFANICNAGVSTETMEEASAMACGNHNAGKLYPFYQGYSA